MNNIIKRVWNQNRMVNIEDLLGMAFQAESGGHTFEISGVNDAGESVPLSGTVAGVFMRPDGTDVALTGSASDGVVSVTLSDACYAVSGRFGLYIFVTSNSRKTCVYACIGTVAQTSYGTVAGDTPQDVVDLINAINAAIASIPADYTDLLDSIAPSFSDSTAYTTGEIVWYDGLLYQFTADKATGSWDATKVRQVSVATAQFDTENLTDGAVTMQKLGSDVIAELDNKANIDGSYESMTVGNAEQLVSSVGIEDQTPYNFRTSGGSTEIGDREELNAIVGGTVAWNQIVPTAIKDFTSTTTDTRAVFFVLRKSSSPYTTLYQKQNVAVGILSSVVASSFDGYAEMTHSGSQRNIRITPVDGFQLVNGHKYYFKVNFTGVDTSTVGGVVAKDIQVYDLTAMFGSTIADYIYALEQSNAGSGVAYFRKLFPKPYYAYNSGELLSVQTNLHKMVGFNQWDEQWELGGYNTTTGEKESASSYFRCVNPIRVIPNTVYYYCSPLGGANVYFYDGDDNYLSYINVARNSTFTTPSNCGYIRFRVYNYGATYNHDICINLSWDGERDGEYEPYQQWNYPLDSSLTLRGILKLDANNNLYADGDRYLPDGTVERRYGVVDLGTLTWTYLATGSSVAPYFYASTNSFPQGNIKFVGNSWDVVYPIICSKYPSVIRNQTYFVDKTITVDGDGGVAAQIQVKDFAYTDAASFKTAMSGVYLVYELATPTTETADPYQQTQIVDDFGTEEFVDAAVEASERDVAIPVGNETVYKPNLRAKLEMAPDSPDGDGDYIVRQTNGQNSYIPLVEVKELPDFPSNDGSYKLRCTVTNGTATLSWVSDS